MQPAFIRELSCDISRPSLNPALLPHPLFAWLTDTLARSSQHHALIASHHPELWHTTFAESFALHLFNTATLPPSLKQAHCFYFTGHSALQENSLATLAPKDRKTIVVFLSLTESASLSDHSVSTLLTPHLSDPRWRFVLLAPSPVLQSLALPRHVCAETLLPAFSGSDTLALLKHERTRLEQCHQVILPDDILATACALASRWLEGHSLAEKALQLLDSAAARAAAHPPQTNKPVVTTALLNNVTADWSHVPTTHLQGNRLTSHALPDALRKEVFGQEEAIREVVRLLQTACLRLETTQGPFCHFLLAGPAHCGKTTLATTLAQFLSGRQHRLIRLRASDHRDTLLASVNRMPYAVILVDEAESLPATHLDMLEEILTRGRLRNTHGRETDFSHTIIILTTTAIQDTTDTPSLTDISPQEAPSPSTDLMQLVLGQPEKNRITPATTETPFLTSRLPISLSNKFPARLKMLMQIVPFLPLTRTAIEKILHHHIALLTQQLEKRIGVTVDILPEVTHFLTQTMHAKASQRPVGQMLEQTLLPCIAQTVYGTPDAALRPERLQVRLNGNGDALICDAVIQQQEAALH